MSASNQSQDKLNIGYRDTLQIDSVEELKGSWPSYRLKGFEEIRTDPMMLFTVYPTKLSEQDTHNLRLDPSVVSSPRFTSSHSFGLPLALSIM